jgi:hypothetical protein
MGTITGAHRIYFAAVGVFAIWVGAWGYFVPGQISRAIPWEVPALHARFLGAMYLSGTVLMFGSLVSGRLAATRIVVPMAAIWTGMLGLVSLLRLGEFDFGLMTVYFWFFAYILYPIAGAWLAWRYRGPKLSGATPLPSLVRAGALLFGLASTILAIALLVAPTWMSTIWPWAIPPLLAHIYSGPFLSYGFGALASARACNWTEARLPLISMAVFAALVLIASALHSGLFTPGSISASLWFGGFALATLFFGAATAGSFSSASRLSTQGSA